MSRLSSFRGPSAPSSSPVPQTPKSPPQKKKNQRSSTQNQPDSPSRRHNDNTTPSSSNIGGTALESTYHRKTRSLLLELKNLANTWDDLVLIDGVRSARSLVDTRTELENVLTLIPGRKPHYHLVGEKLAFMEKKISELDAIVLKLDKIFKRMGAVVDSLESLYFEAVKARGCQWVAREPLWVTWSLEKFVTSVPSIIAPYLHSLHEHTKLVNVLRPHSVTFEVSRDAIKKWVEQPHLEEDGWLSGWEDLCAVEVEKWDLTSER
ncbi:hypothetical protein ONZ45_g17017 [Pleurotus djamor]|nr:hypothetical protein ONZ45_g17017 [Pleurotus djamor]